QRRRAPLLHWGLSMRWLIAGVVLIVSSSSYVAGHKAGAHKIELEFASYREAQAKALLVAQTKYKEQARELQNKQRELERKVASSMAAKKDADSVIYKEVIKYVQSAPSNDCVIDDEWVRIYNASIR